MMHYLLIQASRLVLFTITIPLHLKHTEKGRENIVACVDSFKVFC